MPSKLSRFCIEGLHNKYTIDIPIDDNYLVLVGDNGLYKTTVVNFIFAFLTKQWDRILGYDFKSVSAVIDNEPFEFSRDAGNKIRMKLSLGYGNAVKHLSHYADIPQSLEKFLQENLKASA